MVQRIGRTSDFSLTIPEESNWEEKIGTPILVRDYSHDKSLLELAVASFAEELDDLEASTTQRLPLGSFQYSSTLHRINSPKLQLMLESFQRDINFNILWNKVSHPLFQIKSKELKTVKERREFWNDPKNVNILNSIKELDLSNSGLTAIPQELFQLNNLQKLDLSDKKLKESTIEIHRIDPNKRLNPNRITEIPEEIVKLTKLTELSLAGNFIKFIPKRLGELRELKTLDLSYNIIKDFPIVSEGDYCSVNHLDLSNNCIESLDESFCNISNLSLLYLSNNALESLPRRLTCLNLSFASFKNNKLKEIPPEIENFSSLILLDFSSNLLTKIPDELCDLHTLSNLNLANNQITDLPYNFTRLRNLSKVYLKNNCLTEFPQGLYYMPNLTLLDLSENQFTKVSEELLFFIQKGKVILNDNPLEGKNPLNQSAELVRYMAFKELSKVGFDKKFIAWLETPD